MEGRVSADESVRLFERIRRLEQSVFGVGNEELFDRSVSDPIDYRLKVLMDQTNDRFEASFKDFLSKYQSSPLYRPSTSTATSSVLGTDAQLELLAAGRKSIETTLSQLEEVDRLKGCINTEKFRDRGDHVGRVAKLEPGFVDVMTRAQSIHERVGELTEKYDVVIDVLSEKLFRWDATLTEWERMKQP